MVGRQASRFHLSLGLYHAMYVLTYIGRMDLAGGVLPRQACDVEGPLALPNGCESSCRRVFLKVSHSRAGLCCEAPGTCPSTQPAVFSSPFCLSALLVVFPFFFGPLLFAEQPFPSSLGFLPFCPDVFLSVKRAEPKEGARRAAGPEYLYPDHVLPFGWQAMTR